MAILDNMASSVVQGTVVKSRRIIICGYPIRQVQSFSVALQWIYEHQNEKRRKKMVGQHVNSVTVNWILLVISCD